MSVVYAPRTRGNVFVRLSADEFDRAVEIGRMMRRASLAKGSVDHESIGAGGTAGRYGDAGEWVQILGALAECAVAKLFGLEWKDQEGRYGEADLPGDLEVKLIGRERYGLRVYDSIPAERRVVGVVIPPGRERDPYRVPGWIVAGDARIEEWKMRPYGRGRAFYAVPQGDLRSIWELWRLLRETLG